jgi:hypothetical protein
LSFEHRYRLLQIHGVPQDDRGGNQIETARLVLKILAQPITNRPTAVKEDGPSEGTSARSRIDPFVLSKTDPHEEQDLQLGKTLSSTPKACFVLPTGKTFHFRRCGDPDLPLVRPAPDSCFGPRHQTASPPPIM